MFLFRLLFPTCVFPFSWLGCVFPKFNLYFTSKSFSLDLLFERVSTKYGFRRWGSVPKGHTLNPKSKLPPPPPQKKKQTNNFKIKNKIPLKKHTPNPKPETKI